MHASKSLKLSILAAALAAAGAAHASSYVMADGLPVRASAGECWRTGAWHAELATRACDPQIIAAPAVPVAEEVKSAHAVSDTGSAVSDTAAGPAQPVPDAVAAVAAPAPQRVTFATEVLFDFDGAELRGDGLKVLDDLAQKLVAAELEGVSAVAHADRIGDDAYNERLALRRADAIRGYLVKKGVPEKLVRVDSKGEREPVTGGRCDALGEERRSNANLVACLQPDRRVEIAVAGQRRQTP